jgi:ABC-type proline/glycine betaine transport system ATPase subunit
MIIRTTCQKPDLVIKDGEFVILIGESGAANHHDSDDHRLIEPTSGSILKTGKIQNRLIRIR